MKISAIIASNPAYSYTNIISDYKKVQKHLAFGKTDVENQSVFALNTKRQAKPLEEYIYSSKIKNDKTTLYPQKSEKVYGRFGQTIEKVKEKDYLTAGAMGTLAILYGPEDLREVFSAYEQIKAFFKKEKYIPPYDYKTAQHPFSFFRGSILHKTMNPFAPNAKFKKLKMFLLKHDKSLIDTELGMKFLRMFNINVKKHKTNIEEIVQSPKNKQFVKAIEFQTPNKFGKLVARAMTRTSVLGLAANTAVEVLDAGYQIEKGNDFLSVTSKSAIKLGVNVVTTGLIGAATSKFGPLGSITGTVISGYINNKIEQVVDKTGS